MRTKDWKYSARARGSGWYKYKAVNYYDDYLYDLKNDPYEKNNLVNNSEYDEILMTMRELLSREMEKAGEKKPVFRKPSRTKVY